jgi:hypothetical protein
VLISNRVFFYPVQGDNYYDMHVFLSCLQKSKGAGKHRPEATERRQIFYLQNLRRRWGIWSCRQEPGRGKIWTHRWGSRARSRTDAAGATDDSVDLVWALRRLRRPRVGAVGYAGAAGDLRRRGRERTRQRRALRTTWCAGR